MQRTIIWGNREQTEEKRGKREKRPKADTEAESIFFNYIKMNWNGYTPIAVDPHTSSPSPSSPCSFMVNYIWSCQAIKSCFSSYLPRVVDRIFNRGETFSQSTGEINIHRHIDRKISTHIYRLDWFHTIVDYSTPKCLVILLAFYAAEIIIFATIFYVIYLQCGCGFEFDSYFEAIIFTLGAVNYACIKY